MNKTLKSLLSVAVMSISIASCTQVDLVDELSVQGNTEATLNMPSDWPTTTTILFATRVINHLDYVQHVGNGAKLNIKPGQYKFYVVNQSSEYEYEHYVDSLKRYVSLSVPSSAYYGDSRIRRKVGEAQLPDASDTGIKKVLSGNNYIAQSSHTIYADSTMNVDVKADGSTVVNFQKMYNLTKKYEIEGIFSSDKNVERIYIEFNSALAWKRPNGSSVGASKAKCFVSYTKSRDDRDLKHNLMLLGIDRSGSANVYVRCKGDDKTQAPEALVVPYSVVDGVIKLGKITF